MLLLLLVFKENGYTFRRGHLQIELRILGGLFIRIFGIISKFNSHNLQGLSDSDI